MHLDLQAKISVAHSSTSASTSLQRTKTHYDTLGVPAKATVEKIREAYIHKCKECHPDMNIGDNNTLNFHNKFTRINEGMRCSADHLLAANMTHF